MKRSIRQVLLFLPTRALVCAGTAVAQDSPRQVMQRSQVQERERLEYGRQIQQAQIEQERQRIRNEHEPKMQVQSRAARRRFLRQSRLARPERGPLAVAGEGDRL